MKRTLFSWRPKADNDHVKRPTARADGCAGRLKRGEFIAPGVALGNSSASSWLAPADAIRSLTAADLGAWVHGRDLSHRTHHRPPHHHLIQNPCRRRRLCKLPFLPLPVATSRACPSRCRRDRIHFFFSFFLFMLQEEREEGGGGGERRRRGRE